MDLTSIHEAEGLILASLSSLRIWCCCGCGVGQPALTGPLAWDPPYAASAALKRQKDQKKK